MSHSPVRTQKVLDLAVQARSVCHTMCLARIDGKSEEDVSLNEDEQRILAMVEGVGVRDGYIIFQDVVERLHHLGEFFPSDIVSASGIRDWVLSPMGSSKKTVCSDEERANLIRAVLGLAGLD